jgi:histone H3/H4
MEAQSKPIVKKKKTRYFEIYISKVLKQVSPKNGITSNSKQQLNSILCKIAEIISQNISKLTIISKKKTVSEKEVINSIKIILSGQLADKAIEEGVRAVERFKNDKYPVKGSSRQDKSGIIFPPSIAEKFLRNFGYYKVMVTSLAPICLAAALEYLTAEILELASGFTGSKHVRLTIRDLEMAVRNDIELNELFNKQNITFLGGGSIPYIHPSLLIKKTRKKRIKIIPAVEKKRRFRPGTVAIREIKKFQKMSNLLTFAKYPFEKLVRKIVNNKHAGTSMKISKDVFITLQYFIEQYIINILENANRVSVHTGRVKLVSADIKLVNTILHNTSSNKEYKNNVVEEQEDDDEDDEDEDDDEENEEEDEDEQEEDNEDNEDREQEEDEQEEDKEDKEDKEQEEEEDREDKEDKEQEEEEQEEDEQEEDEQEEDEEDEQEE